MSQIQFQRGSQKILLGKHRNLDSAVRHIEAVVRRKLTPDEIEGLRQAVAARNDPPAH